ncbi:hypothetical protein SNE40_022461 [Patella caerulea]
MAELSKVAFLMLITNVLSQNGKARNVTLSPGCEHVLVPEETILQTFKQSIIFCSLQCVQDNKCLSIQYKYKDKRCTLSNHTVAFGCRNLTIDFDVYHFEEPCLNGGYLNASGRCKCVDGWIGMRCEKLMTNCVEGVPYGHELGLYHAHPVGAAAPVRVFCSIAGRIAVVRRLTVNVVTDFNRTWADYKKGFGRLPNEMWLGLDNLHYLTRQLRYRLITYIWIKNNTWFRGQHLNFMVSGEQSNYVMNYSRAMYNVNNTLGDSMADMNGQPFSTYDRDNDNATDRNCAAEYGGGYWFNACGQCNPTGPIIRPDTGYRLNVTNEIFWTDHLGDLAPFRIYQFLYYDGKW